MLTFIKTHQFRLFQFSFLLFFVELTIIRFTGANIYYLFAFANFILIASFLGMGIGFLRSHSAKNLFGLSPLFLTFILFLSDYFSVDYTVTLNPKTDNLDYFATVFHNHVYPIWFTLPLIFCLVVALMLTLADGVKRAFQVFSPLEAYRLEILGSLSGLLVFTLFSFCHAKPLAWGIIIFLCYLSLLNIKEKNNVLMQSLQIISLALMIFIFAKESMTPNHFWSSYYKIVLKPYSFDRYAVDVNGLIQQVIESVDQRKKVKPFYFVPYQNRIANDALDRVLVIGAGTGGDVAIALSEGAKHVDAVEIDPVLYTLGKNFNKDHPYDDPRVTVFINDGRAFLQQNKEKYDMIIFALTDSLMLIMGQSSLRLENYLYTQEGLTAAANHLKPHGIFTFYNYIQPEWFVDRMANTLTKIFHQPPCMTKYDEKDYWATVLTNSFNPSSLRCNHYWNAQQNPYMKPATDDHPFIYLKDNHLSSLYLFLLGFILIISLCFIKIFGGHYATILKYFDLFLMGIAFLLLETKNIIHFALLFGTTWLVNALVFIGILFSVYLAVEVANWAKNLKPFMLYILLITALALSWFMPNSSFLNLSPLPRFLFATALAFSPIFIANLIFSSRFKTTRQSTAAFGANLLGAVVGGLLEYSAILIGYRHLFIVIAVLYTIAILFMIFSKQTGFAAD